LNAGCLAGSGNGETPSPFEVKLESVSQGAFPFQPLRFRLWVTNKAGLAEYIFPLERNLDLYAGKPSSGETRRLGWPVLIGKPPEPGLAMCGPMPGVAGMPLLIAPGASCSLSFVLAAEWTDAEGKLLPGGTGVPLCPKAGEFQFKCKTLLLSRGKGRNTGEDVIAEALAKVAVRQPEGDDKAVCEMLEQNPRLASALMSPVHFPQRELVPELQRLLDKYPRSSFADYARFAVARANLSGNFDSQNWEKRRDEAIAMLEKLAPNPFGYQSYVLVALHGQYLKTDREKALVIRDRLVKEYPDALEWLGPYSGYFHGPGAPQTPLGPKKLSPEDWLKYRTAASAK
jgi:hypothetical protein